MKTNKLLVSFVTALIAILAISSIAAADLNVSIDKVEVNDEEVTSSSIFAFSTSEDIEVMVKFSVPMDTLDPTANDLDNVKVKVWISGYKNDIEDSTARFDVLSGRIYTKKLYLELPDVKDLEDLEEDLTLHVEISDKNKDIERKYALTVQRESYTFDLLSVEAPSKAKAGDIIAIDVVLKNTGRQELEDSFVVARISELGVYKKTYFGDIAPEDNYAGDDDAEDARERRLYLVIPADVVSGEYDIEVKASNYDTISEVVKSITIEGITSEDSVIDTTGEDNKVGISNSVVVLTVVLVIVFIVLLIVLIVLLTKKPTEKIEDFGETSYY